MANDATRKAKLPPTLIVGLGGTGCEIVSMVDKLSNNEQRKFIRFVYFDTDANELRVRKEEAPYIFTVQTSRRLTVGQALRNDSEARKYSFPTTLQLLNKPLSEGAGQVRAVSKLAFDACLREGRITPLHDAINELQKLNGDNLEQSMRVVIVSTLVGGTGSGIILPLSMYIRNYLENACQKKPLIRGLCVLPDVFFHGGNKSESEKNNLRANAYATLRELDAFMLKADSTQAGELSKKFWLKMPRPGTVDEYDDYSVNPMDFCFLFDGQNMDGDGLQNFEAYKRHAADCIYASSISLLSKRLNSSEDNTILQRCAENGRNRYCGIGTSKIVYPFAEVRDYIAMSWMAQSMTDDWLRYDKLFEQKLISQQISKTRGVMLPPIDKRDFYCNAIESEQGESNYFSLSVYEECYNKDKLGVSFTTPKWETYYDKLRAFIDAKVLDDVGYDEGIADKIQETIGQLSGYSQEADASDFVINFNKLPSLLRVYFSKTKRHAEDIANAVSDSIFSPANFDISSEHHIEHWLTKGTIPLHPNAIRYFLYSLEKLFKEERRRLMTPADMQSEAVENNEDFDGIESFADLEKAIKTFFDAKTYPLDRGDETESVNIETYVQSIRKKGLLSKKDDLRDKMDLVINKCRDQSENIRKFYSTYLRLTVINEALDYLNKLANNYEYFYQQLDTEIKRIPRKIERIEESFVNNNGSPVMYACASDACLKGLARRCPNSVDSIQLTEDFRRELFVGLFETMGISDEEQRISTINNLASQRIMNFWRDEVIKQYGKKVDIDIIDALRTQAELEENKFEADEQLYYIQGKHDEALKLAAPFIDRPIGREPYIIDACAVSNEVCGSDDMTKSFIMRKVFSGCEKDALMDKYQVLFMKALYDLRVSDLPKFAPEDKLKEDSRKEGDYYKAYWTRIDGIIPDSTKTRILTPHLDKRWHFIGVMPDLSEASEKRCCAEAHKAFLVSVAYGFVRFDRDQYRFLNKDGDFISDAIIVSDGRCNKLHEIYEAMLMSRPLVHSMLDRFKEKTDKEAAEESIGNKNYTNTLFYKVISEMHIRAFDCIPKISFLELPILCKASSGNSSYNDDDSVIMLQNFIDFIEEYLTQFYKVAFVRNNQIAEWLEEQLNLMMDNMAEYYDSGSDTIIMSPFSESLVNRTVNIVIGKIRSFETCDKAEEIAQKLSDRWDSLANR